MIQPIPAGTYSDFTSPHNRSVTFSRSSTPAAVSQTNASHSGPSDAVLERFALKNTRAVASAVLLFPSTKV
ncbi:MAG: hypothetical protein N2035_08975 [Chthoniobacterales bacterium]|nr:hypothetical protein [Chthoniobacterales bacterium]